MFIRPCYREKNGKRHAYWALVESYRTECGPRQRVVAYLGKLEQELRQGVKHAAEGNAAVRQSDLFEKSPPRWVEVDASRVRVERCRDFGGPWLALELARKVGLLELLRELIPSGREDVPWPEVVMALVAARLREPSSELHIAEHFYSSSAMSDLLGRPIWHQREDRVRAHVLVCFLAYVLWKTLAQMCEQCGLGQEPRRVFEELAKLRAVDVILPTRQGVEIRKRCVMEPTEHQAILLGKLGLDLPRSIKRTKM